MKTLALLSSTTIALSLAACSSGGLSHRIEADGLAGVSPARQAELAALDQSLETARGEKAKSEKDLALATYELEKARKNLELVESRTEHMQGLKDAAETLGDEKRVEDADVVLNGLSGLQEAHEEEIEWLEAEVEYYEVGIELNEAKVQVAEAQVMEARAEAVHKADLPQKVDYPLEDFKIQLSEKMSAAADLETSSAKAWKAVQEEKAEFQVALASVSDVTAADKKALTEVNDKNREMSDEMKALRKQVERLSNDNDRLQTTLATQKAGTVAAPVAAPGGGAVQAGAVKDDDSGDKVDSQDKIESDDKTESDD